VTRSWPRSRSSGYFRPGLSGCRAKAGEKRAKSEGRVRVFPTRGSHARRIRLRLRNLSLGLSWRTCYARIKSRAIDRRASRDARAASPLRKGAHWGPDCGQARPGTRCPFRSGKGREGGRVFRFNLSHARILVHESTAPILLRSSFFLASHGPRIAWFSGVSTAEFFKSAVRPPTSQATRCFARDRNETTTRMIPKRSRARSRLNRESDPRRQAAERVRPRIWWNISNEGGKKRSTKAAWARRARDKPRRNCLVSGFLHGRATRPCNTRRERYATSISRGLSRGRPASFADAYATAGTHKGVRKGPSLRVLERTRITRETTSQRGWRA